MEEWNSLPNYSSAYHTYAYGMTYPPPPVQNHPSLGWSGSGFTPSGSDGLFLDVPPTAPQNALPQDATRVPGVPLAGSPGDSSSETEPSTPDSWSSPSADESYALRPPPAPCSPAETACAEPVPAPCSWAEGAEELGQQQGALLDMEPGAAPAAGKRARKLRTAFSETQMTALCERYMIKMYLTPAEMKSLADKIGLSYKQVKTWFQNRRMKQKRQQKTLTEGEEQVPSSGYPIIPPLLLESSSSAYPNIPPLALVSTSSAYTNIQAQTSESSAYPNAQAEASESSPYPSIQTQSFEDLGSVYPNFQAQTLESPTSVHASVSPQTSESPTAVYPNVSPQTSKSSSLVYPNISPQFSVNPNCPYPNIPLVTSEIPSSLYSNVSPNILEGPSSAYPNLPPQFRGFYSTSQFGNQGYFKKNPPPFYPTQPCYPSRVNVAAGSLESWALPSAGRFKYGSLNGPIRYSGKVIGYECVGPACPGSSAAPLQPQASAALPQWGEEELQIPASFRK